MIKGYEIFHVESDTPGHSRSNALNLARNFYCRTDLDLGRMNKAPKEEPATLLLALLLLMKSVLALSFLLLRANLISAKSSYHDHMIHCHWQCGAIIRKHILSTLHPNRLQHVCKPQISIPHCHFIVIGDLFTSCLDSKFRTLLPETATLNSGSGKATRRNINSLINRVPKISRRGSRVAPGQPMQLDSDKE